MAVRTPRSLHRRTARQCRFVARPLGTASNDAQSIRKAPGVVMGEDEAEAQR